MKNVVNTIKWCLAGVSFLGVLSRLVPEPIASPGFPTNHAHPQTPKDDADFYNLYFSHRLDAMKFLYAQFCIGMDLPDVNSSSLHNATCDTAQVLTESLERQLQVTTKSAHANGGMSICSSGNNTFGLLVRRLSHLQEAAGTTWLRANALAFGGHFIARKNAIVAGQLTTPVQRFTELVFCILKAGVSGKLPNAVKLAMMSLGYALGDRGNRLSAALTQDEFTRLRRFSQFP
jgi:hypothetical protein